MALMTSSLPPTTAVGSSNCAWSWSHEGRRALGVSVYLDDSSEGAEEGRTEASSSLRSCGT